MKEENKRCPKCREKIEDNNSYFRMYGYCSEKCGNACFDIVKGV